MIDIKGLTIASLLVNSILILFIVAVMFIPVVSGWFFNLNAQRFLSGFSQVYGAKIEGLYQENSDGSLTIWPLVKGGLNDIQSKTVKIVQD